MGYHRNIRIEDNVFLSFHERLLKARCTDSLSVTGNRIEASSAYPSPPGSGQAFDLSHCSHVNIAGNENRPLQPSFLSGPAQETADLHA